MPAKHKNTKTWDDIYKKGAHWEKEPGPSGSIKKFVKYLKEHAKCLKKDYKLLEIGCGSGRDSVFLAKTGFKVTGLDISREAIKKAKARFHADNLNFMVGDAENLPFENNSFDAVYAGWVLQSLPLKKVSSEIFRVLKKGGIAYLAFLLDMKMLKIKEVREFCRKKDILSAYKDFVILKQFKTLSLDKETDELGVKHTHNKFIIVLGK